MKNFSKQLTDAEAVLQKMSGYFNKENMNNNVYRVSSIGKNINLHNDFNGNLLGLDIGGNFDEK